MWGGRSYLLVDDVVQVWDAEVGLDEGDLVHLLGEGPVLDVEADAHVVLWRRPSFWDKHLLPDQETREHSTALSTKQSMWTLLGNLLNKCILSLLEFPVDSFKHHNGTTVVIPIKATTFRMLFKFILIVQTQTNSCFIPTSHQGYTINGFQL